MCPMPVPGQGTRWAFRNNLALLPGALVADKALVLRTAQGSGKGLSSGKAGWLLLVGDRRVSGELQTP